MSIKFSFIEFIKMIFELILQWEKENHYVEITVLCFFFSYIIFFLFSPIIFIIKFGFIKGVCYYIAFFIGNAIIGIAITVTEAEERYKRS